MSTPNELTSVEIAQIRALLQEKGLDSSVPIQMADNLPSEKELGSGRLTSLGPFKHHIAWAWKLGSTLLAILLLPQDCLDVQRFYVPKCHAVYEQVARVMDVLTTNPPSEVAILPNHPQDSYYAFSPEWRSLSDEDLQKMADGSAPISPNKESFPGEQFTIIGSSNTSPSIISGSGLIRIG